jgi:hypothetical protein
MKRRGFEGDPIEALRGADPLDPLDVPKDTTGPHARALFQEVTTMDTMERETTVRTRPPVRRRFALAAAGVAAAALVVASIAVFGGNGTTPDEVIAGDEPIVGGEPIAAAAMCAEFYDLDTLAGREIAFDGTVASSAGDQVTFTVHDWFTGDSGDSVTLDAQGIAPGTITSAGPALEIGKRYLVSGSGGNVWSCGFTMTYDTAIANQWATVFSG